MSLFIVIIIVQVELSGHYSKQRLLRTVFPSVLMVMITSIYVVIDGLFVSNFTGKTNFAAINLVWPVIVVFASLGVMVGTGGAALVSKTKGEGDNDKANRIFSMLVEFAAVLGVVLGFVVFLLMPTIIRWLQADEAMFAPAVLYGRILLVALPFGMLQQAFTPFFMAAERPDLGTKFSLISGVANIIFDALFIVVFDWGVFGAASATLISQAIGGLGPLVYFSTKRNHSSLRLSLVGWERSAIVKTCLNGSSEFVGNISYSVVSICYNLQLMRYMGQDGVAAYGVVMYTVMIFYSLFWGYNYGVSPIVAYNYGAQDHAELHSLLKKSAVLIMWGGVLMLLLAEVFAQPVTRIFTSYDPELWRLTTYAFRLYLISILFGGFNVFVSAFFTALNNGPLSATISFVRSFVLEVGSVFLLPLLLGPDGIWFSVVVAEIICFAASVVIIRLMRKRYHY